MNQLKVVKLDGNEVVFNNGIKLSSFHDRECCERHYLDFSILTLDDFEGLVFDLTSNNFFKRIENYGIELVPINGYSVKVPGYASNTGNYSSDLHLVLMDNNDIIKNYDISECQEWDCL